jgi:iduronate 2-sulfatase
VKPPAGLAGVSLAPAVADPAKRVKEAAFTQHPRPAYFDRTEKGVPEAMGYSVRTAAVRYTEWRDWETGKVLAAELYGPDERANRVADPPDARALEAARAALHKQFPPDTPPSRR